VRTRAKDAATFTQMRSRFAPTAAIAALTLASCGATSSTTSPNAAARRSSLALFSARVNAACARHDANHSPEAGGGISRVLKVGEVPVPAVAAPLVKRLEVAMQASLADRQSFIASFSRGSEALNRADTVLARSDKEIARLETQLDIRDCKYKGPPRKPLEG
jgi:hypothetical protein